MDGTPGGTHAMEIPATQPTLLQRLRDPADEDAWRTFESRYRELIVRFARSRGRQQADAEDIAQLVLSSLFGSLRRFEYDRSRGRFRDYLFRCTRNAIARQAGKRGPTPAGDELMDQVEAADPGEVEAWDREWEDHHYRLAMASIRRSFEPASVAIFERCLRGDAIRDIAADASMSEPAVHKVKQRIRDRMRELIAEQVRDEES
jgi:RNA polymerase sigma-70 factor (ECF subfamily)